MAETITTTGIVELIERQVRATIEQIVDEELASATGRAAVRIHERVHASVDKIALSVLQEYEITSDAASIVIRVKKELR